MDSRMLNVVDEEGDVLYEATRQEIHEKGLLHAEIHVWFFTSDGKILFQHRAKDKDTFPDLLDATVGGHVEIGDTYDATALKEAGEEAGITPKSENLTFLCTTVTNDRDEVTGMVNHPRRNVYAYQYDGRLEDLQIEQGKSLGFEAWPIDELFNLSDEDRKRFVPPVIDERGMEIYRQIRGLLK